MVKPSAKPAAKPQAAPKAQPEATMIETPAAPAATESAPAAAEGATAEKTRKPSVSVAGLYVDVPVDDDIPAPTHVPDRSGGGRPGYPFYKLERAGQSFFIAKSDLNPNPIKRLTQAVNSANKKTVPQGFRYICLPATIEKDGRTIEGARVWRLAVDAAPSAQTPQAA